MSTAIENTSAPGPGSAEPAPRPFQRLSIAAVILAAAFGWPLFQLIKFASHSELFSYILLIPFISGYLVWSMRNNLDLRDVRPCWSGAVLGFAAGAAVLAIYWLYARAGWHPELQDHLTLMTLSFLLCFWGLCLATLGARLCGQILFPLAFLACAVPMPKSWQLGIDSFFQYASGDATQIMCKIAGEPLFRDGLVLTFFDYPMRVTAYSIRIASECSGIHSTLVLLMTSFLASYLLLSRWWTRTVMVLFVVPLAIARNGFRVFVIGWLCVHKGHKMIDSPIHHQGGPIFFALSLIPFFLLLLFLRKLDLKARPALCVGPES